MENLILLLIGIIIGYGLGYIHGVNFNKPKSKSEKDNKKTDKSDKDA